MGDIVLVNDNKIMVSGSHKDARITIDVEDKVTALAEADNDANRIALISRTTKNMIGEFSNYASVYLNRKPRDDEQIKRYEMYTDIISVLTGKSIDFAKTGVFYPMPRNISKYGRPLPWFMKYRSAYYAKQKLSRAPSNMNRLCWDLERWERGVRWEKKGMFDYHLMYNEAVTYTDEQFKQVEQIFLEFCKECTKLQKYQNIVHKYEDKNIRAKFTRAEATTYIADWDSLYQEYKEKCAAVCPDERVLANIAVILTYEKYRTRGRKFPWIVAPNGLIENIKPKDLMYIPEQDDNGEYTYLGKRYTLRPMLSEELDISIEKSIYDEVEVIE